MTESDDSPLPKPRKKFVPLGPSSIPVTPESPLNLVIKRRAIKSTPPEPARSTRESYLENPLLEHEAKEVGRDGATNSSVSDFSSDDEDIDDSCITHGSHPDGSPSIYMQGQMSQNDLFSTPLHKTRHSGRVPLHEEIEARLNAAKLARKHAKLAAEAAAEKGILLDIPIPALVQSAPATSPTAEAVARKVIIPLMFQRRQAEFPVPMPVPISSALSSAPMTPSRVQNSLIAPVPPTSEVITVSDDSPLPQLRTSVIVPESPIPKLPPPLLISQTPSGRPSQFKMKLPKNVRSIAVQTLPQKIATASVAVQASDDESPITLKQLRSELQSLHALFNFCS